MSIFRIRSSLYNTVDLQDLSASLSQFINNPNNQINSITLTPSQILSLTSTTPILVLSGPGPSKYNILNSCITELLFNTGNSQYNYEGSSNQVIYTYGTNNLNNTGIVVDTNVISTTGASIGFTRSNGIVLGSVNDMLNTPIYMNTLITGSAFINGNSNVKLIFNYSTYNYP